MPRGPEPVCWGRTGRPPPFRRDTAAPAYTNTHADDDLRKTKPALGLGNSRFPEYIVGLAYISAMSLFPQTMIILLEIRWRCYHKATHSGTESFSSRVRTGGSRGRLPLPPSSPAVCVCTGSVRV